MILCRDFIHGVNTILRYIARVASVTSFYGQDAIQAAYVDQWLDYAPVILSGSEFEAACSFLDGYLASRTFLVSYGLSIADIVVWSNLAGNCLVSFIIYILSFYMFILLTLEWHPFI
jgi:glutamyl-tRNA synthetase